jgi:hypothetical protein
MVEAAFVTPVFVVLLFGLFEFSGYVSAASGANAAVKAGSRMATIAGSDAMADRSILNRMNREGAGLVASNDIIEEIKIWHAASRDSDPPATCDAASQCDHYVDPNQAGGAYHKAALPLTTDEDPTAAMSPGYADCYFGYGWGVAADTSGCLEANRLDKGWPTKDRRILEKSPNHLGTCVDRQCDTTDLVGIWIKVRHVYYTGIFGKNVTVTAKTVAKIEPQGYDK